VQVDYAALYSTAQARLDSKDDTINKLQIKRL
jgi:hypothetical protein